MFEPSQLTIFIAASLALLLVPGPAVIYIVTRSVNQGRVGGLASVLGIETASLFHILAASLGLSAILLSSALAFDIVKYIGAAYLIYLGLRKLIVREEEHQSDAVKHEAPWRIFTQGLVVNLLNPKTALFFFAFLPQFVNVEKGSITLQVVTLGLLFVGLATITDGTYALLASSIADRLKGNLTFLKRQRYFTGAVYIGLGITTAFSGINKK
jgi:threonine/homoserine/homoserine lactone efflux protein